MGEIEIRQKLIDEIEDYCKFNDMTNVGEFIHNMLEKGFNIEKYGNVPEMYQPDAEVIEKPIEVVKEVIKIVEVPVEKIVEVIKEVIKTVEVPVEVIKEVIKEVPVEKIVEKEIIIEVIKEVPVDKVITVDKEVAVDKIVEKRVTVKDDEEVKRLKEKISLINLEFREKIRTFEIDNDKLKNDVISLKEKVFELRSKPPKVIEKPIEVIKEVIKEVPVEKVVIQEKPVEVIKEVIPNDKIRYHMLVVDVRNKLYESKIVLKESDVDKFINKADAKYHMKTVETLKDYHIIKKVLIKPYYDTDGTNYDIYGE